MTQTLWRRWQDLTTAEFRGLEPERTVALLPVGAIEQHGPHLPVGVDTRINDGILERAGALAPATPAVLLLPTIPVGKSNEHQDFAGTLTLSAETLIRVLTDLGESVGRAGVRKLVLFNSHGGQPQILDIVAQDLRTRLSMLVVSASWFAFGPPAGTFDGEEARHGIHGGGIETSIMLHLAPGLVREDERRDFRPLGAAMAKDHRWLGPVGPVPFAWQAQDLNPTGACGNALDADAERGRRLIEHAAGCLVELLVEVERFPLERLRPPQG